MVKKINYKDTEVVLISFCVVYTDQIIQQKRYQVQIWPDHTEEPPNMLVMVMMALLGLVFVICVNVAKGLTGKICLLECWTHLAALSLCLSCRFGIWKDFGIRFLKMFHQPLLKGCYSTVVSYWVSQDSCWSCYGEDIPWEHFSPLATWGFTYTTPLSGWWLQREGAFSSSWPLALPSSGGWKVVGGFRNNAFTRLHRWVKRR